MLRQCELLSCTFEHLPLFLPVIWWTVKMLGSVFRDCTVTALHISGGNWAYTALRQMDLSHNDLSGVRLDGADLSGCDLQDCDFTGCSMREAVLAEADLRGADLRGADLWGVDLRSARIHQTRIDLTEAVRLAEQSGYLVEV